MNIIFVVCSTFFSKAIHHNCEALQELLLDTSGHLQLQLVWAYWRHKCTVENRTPCRMRFCFRQQSWIKRKIMYDMIWYPNCHWYWRNGNRPRFPRKKNWFLYSKEKNQFVASNVQFLSMQFSIINLFLLVELHYFVLLFEFVRGIVNKIPCCYYSRLPYWDGHSYTLTLGNVYWEAPTVECL